MSERDTHKEQRDIVSKSPGKRTIQMERINRERWERRERETGR